MPNRHSRLGRRAADAQPRIRERLAREGPTPYPTRSSSPPSSARAFEAKASTNSQRKCSPSSTSGRECPKP